MFGNLLLTPLDQHSSIHLLIAHAMSSTQKSNTTSARQFQSITTELIHPSYQPPADFASPQPAVQKASTVFFPNVAAMRSRQWQDKSAYTYGLHGTPNSYLLEEKIAALEGARYCVLAPSGLSAIALVNLALLKSGDQVLIPDNIYGPNKAMFNGQLAAFGITWDIYDPLNAQDLADKITSATRLVWLEAAGSVTLEFPDLLGLIKVCKEKSVYCALDNTWGAGLAFNAFELANGQGVDITTHALTKYPSGGGDVLMGSVCTRDLQLHKKMVNTHMHLGIGVGGNDLEAIQRGLPSIALRYQAHDSTTRQLATWATQQAAFAQVLHPALPDSPGHSYWKEVCTDAIGRAAGIFSVVFHESISTQQVDVFCDALRLFKLGYSWAGPVSLVVPYDLPSMRSLNQNSQKPIKKGVLVRFCIGLESVEDLQADLQQALKIAGW